MGAFLNFGNNLLNDVPFLKSADLNFKQPISNVSTQPTVGFDATKLVSNFGDLFVKDTLDVSLSPAVKSNYGIYNPFGSTTYVNSPLNIKSATQAIGQVNTLQQSSGKAGNIWDTFGNILSKGIDAGFNILTSKFASKPTTQNTASVATGTRFIQDKPALQTYYPGGNPFASMMSDWINPILQPSIEAGIQKGVQGGITTSISQPPVWIWIVLAGLGLVLLLRRA
jgi:hypothetical protein